MKEKPRGRPKRSWVKLDCQGCLHGSINYQLTLEEQAIWFKLIMYSAVCGGDAGFICDNDGRPMPKEYIAQELHCPLETLEATLERCVKEGRVKDNSAGIEIINFAAYQFTEYDRQRPSREARKAGKRTHKQCPTCGFKAETAEVYCPECDKKGTSTELQRDYTAGKYGQRVQR